MIKEFATSAPYPIGDSAMAALYQAGMQNTDFTAFRDAGFVGLNFAFIDGVAWYHNSVDTVAQLDTAGLQHMGSNMLGLTRGFGQRDLAELRSEHDASSLAPLDIWWHARCGWSGRWPGLQL